MNDVNIVAITGNVVKDAETKQLPNGKYVIAYSVAVNKQYENKEDVSYIDVKTYVGKPTLASYILKGTPIAVSGEIKQERWTQTDGTARSHVVLVGYRVRLFSGNRMREYAAEADIGINTTDIPF